MHVCVCVCMHACVVNNRVCYNLYKLSTVVASRKHSQAEIERLLLVMMVMMMGFLWQLGLARAD